MNCPACPELHAKLRVRLCSPLRRRRTHKLPVPLQRMLLAVGLRGAVAYGLGELAMQF